MVYTLEAEEAMPWVQRHVQMLAVALVLKATKNNRVIRMQEQRKLYDTLGILPKRIYQRELTL